MSVGNTEEMEAVRALRALAEEAFNVAAEIYRVVRCSQSAKMKGHAARLFGPLKEGMTGREMAAARRERIKAERGVKKKQWDELVRQRDEARSQTSTITDIPKPRDGSGGYWDGWADGVESVRTVGQQAIAQRDDYQRLVEVWRKRSDAKTDRITELEAVLNGLCEHTLTAVNRLTTLGYHGSALVLNEARNQACEALAGHARPATTAQESPCPHCGTMLKPLPAWIGVIGVLCPECGKNINAVSLDTHNGDKK